jgi:hypothetical protein
MLTADSSLFFYQRFITLNYWNYSKEVVEAGGG